MKRKTDPTELALRGMPRCRTARGGGGGGAEEGAGPGHHPPRGSRGRGRKNFAATPSQVGNIITTCLPAEEAIFFEKALLDKCATFVENACSAPLGQQGQESQERQDPNVLGYLSKVPVQCILEALKECFPTRCVRISRLSSVADLTCGFEPISDTSTLSPGSITVGSKPLSVQGEWLQFYLLECLVNFAKRPPRVANTKDCSNKTKHCVDNDTSPVPKKVTCRGRSKGVKPVADDIGRCVVVVSPDAGIFYSMHERLGCAATSQNPTQHAVAPPMQEAGNSSTTGTSVRMSHNTTARVVSDKTTPSRPFLPMDISWLRIRRDSPPVGRPGDHDTESDPWFCDGGYIKSLYSSPREDGANALPRAWKVVISDVNVERLRTNLPVRVLRLNQAPDTSLPPLPPDVFIIDKKGTESCPANIDAARIRFKTELQASPSSKGRCRHYVAGAMHRNIPQGAYVMRPSIDGPFDLVISVKTPRLYSSCTGPREGCLPDATEFDFVTGSCEPFTCHSAIVADTTTGDDMVTTTNATIRKWTKWITARESVVKVRYISTDQKLMHSLASIRQLGNQLRVRAKNKKCRDGHGDLGKMYAMGSRVYTTDGVTNLIPYSCNAVAGTVLPTAVSALHDVGISCFPSALRSLQTCERLYGLPTLECMERMRRAPPPLVPSVTSPSFRVSNVSLTVDSSCNLSNSSHYDVNDGSVGYAVWTEDIPGLAKNWFFVLPNVYGYIDGKPFSGLAIQLTHGVAIQWDGRIIRHCTSMVEPGVGNHVYGTFCAAKAKVVDFGRKLFEEDRLRQKYLSRVFEDGDEQADASSDDDDKDSSDDDDKDQDGSPPVSGDIQSIDPLANMKVPRKLDAATSANSVNNRESKQTILGTRVELMGPVIYFRGEPQPRRRERECYLRGGRNPLGARGIVGPPFFRGSRGRGTSLTGRSAPVRSNNRGDGRAAAPFVVAPGRDAGQMRFSRVAERKSQFSVATGRAHPGYLPPEDHDH